VYEIDDLFDGSDVADDSLRCNFAMPHFEVFSKHEIPVAKEASPTATCSTRAPSMISEMDSEDSKASKYGDTTAAMIHNLPRTMHQNQFVEVILEFCWQKGIQPSLVYLPMVRNQKRNRAYACVQFLSHHDTDEFVRSFKKFELNGKCQKVHTVFWTEQKVQQSIEDFRSTSGNVEPWML
jgi:hypothetical protein